MQWHRFREYVDVHEPAQASGAAGLAFVPLSIVALVPLANQASIVEVYRIAAERTRAQLASRVPSRQPRFSFN
jgi:hypothetical protein